jgi:predicted RNase H-like nuclease (RuvC/YqgF family)
VIPSLDHDMLRIKIINELDAPHRAQLEQKQHEIGQLQNELFDYKREVNLLKAKIEEINL